MVFDIAWFSDSKHIISASQEGKLIVWNTITSNKVKAYGLTCTYVLSVAASPSTKLIACGGLDNEVSVYNHDLLSESFVGSDLAITLEKHAGFISSIDFFNDSSLVSASGDKTLVHWDLEKKSAIRTFNDHMGDIMSVCIKREVGSLGSNLMLTGSTDSTSKLFDVREKAAVHTYKGHRADINSAKFLKNKDLFLTGSDDGTVGLWDMRSNSMISRYVQEERNACVGDVDASGSGRFIFSSLEDKYCIVWDSLTGNKVQTLEGHEKRISRISLSPDGGALCTASWDRTLRIWV